MSGIAQGMRRTRIGGRTFIVGSSRRDKRSSRTLMEMQFLVQNRKLCYIFALVGSIERRGQKRIEQPAEGRTDFFCNCQTGPQCWKPPSTGLILRRPLPEAKGLEGPSRGANEATHWAILRDVKLRFPPQDEVAGFRGISKLHLGSYFFT